MTAAELDERIRSYAHRKGFEVEIYYTSAGAGLEWG